MTDKNYNDIDIFDIKGFKNCEQVREEKLKEKKEVSKELAQRLDEKYGFDGGVYYQDNPWWEENYK